MLLTDSEYSYYKGSKCYCSPTAAARMRRSIARKPLSSTHLLGSGNYHYVSLFWLERIEEPFSLLLFDNHEDKSESAFGGGTLSCGSWVKDALKHPFLRDFRWIRTFPESRNAAEVYEGISSPVYLSIDLDVLSREYARTNWDQGTMSLGELSELLLSIPGRIIGADICGAESDSEKMLSPTTPEENRRCIYSIAEILQNKLQDGPTQD